MSNVRNIDERGRNKSNYVIENTLVCIKRWTSIKEYFKKHFKYLYNFNKVVKQSLSDFFAVSILFYSSLQLFDDLFY